MVEYTKLPIYYSVYMCSQLKGKIPKNGIDLGVVSLPNTKGALGRNKKICMRI